MSDGESLWEYAGKWELGHEVIKATDHSFVCRTDSYAIALEIVWEHNERINKERELVAGLYDGTVKKL